MWEVLRHGLGVWYGYDTCNEAAWRVSKEYEEEEMGGGGGLNKKESASHKLRLGTPR